MIKDSTVKVTSYFGGVRARSSKLHQSFIIIPDTVQHEGNNYVVTEIGSYAFAARTKIKMVHIPPTVKIIDIAAFANCTNLLSVRFPQGVIIRSWAFRNCYQLQYVRLLGGLISSEAFVNCNNLQKVVLDKPCLIDKKAFMNCPALDTVQINMSLFSVLRDSAFVNCSESLIMQKKEIKRLEFPQKDFLPLVIYHKSQLLLQKLIQTIQVLQEL